jgi:hypothetical protein
MVSLDTGEVIGVWTASQGGNGLGFLRFDPQSGVMASGPMVVLQRPGLRHPRITHRSGELGVVWEEELVGSTLLKYEVFFIRLGDSGIPLGAPVRVSDL